MLISHKIFPAEQLRYYDSRGCEKFRYKLEKQPVNDAKFSLKMDTW